MSAPVLTRRRLNRATLARQLLLEREEIGVVEAVERVGGLQAQEPRPPFIGLWSRVAGFDGDELRRAIRERTVLRGTMMRATLHLVGARDHPVFRAAVQPVLDAAMASVLKARGTAGLDLEALLRAAREILAEGPLRFDELRPRLQERFPGVDDRALGYAVRMALPLVMEPSEDTWGYPRSAAFGLAERSASRQGAAELARRYLAAFGPASPADFQTWSGLPRSVLGDLRPELEAYSGEDGRELLDLPGAPLPDEDVPAPVRLLPDFDSLLLAHADRTRVIADEHRPLVATKNLRIKATFLVDGEVAGTWALKGRKVVLEPFGRLPTAARAELEAEGERLGEFLKAQP